MNFLLHRYLARAELGSDEAALGSMLPDLWRMADRRVRARRLRVEIDGDGVGADRDLRRLANGVDHHLDADDWFHAHPVLLDGERRAIDLLREAAPAVPKIGLFGHIAWELCLDGALVRYRGLDNELADLRRALEATRPEALRGVAELHHPEFLENTSADRRDLFETRLADLFHHLALGDWIAGYQHGGGVLDRLSGVRRRLGLPTMSPEYRQPLSSALDHLLDDAEKGLRTLLDERQPQDR